MVLFPLFFFERESGTCDAASATPLTFLSVGVRRTCAVAISSVYQAHAHCDCFMSRMYMGTHTYMYAPVCVCGQASTSSTR